MSEVVKPYWISPRELYSFKKRRNTYYMAIMLKDPLLCQTMTYEDALEIGKGNVIHVPITKKQYDVLIKHRVE